MIYGELDKEADRHPFAVSLPLLSCIVSTVSLYFVQVCVNVSSERVLNFIASLNNSFTVAHNLHLFSAE